VKLFFVLMQHEKSTDLYLATQFLGIKEIWIAMKPIKKI